MAHALIVFARNDGNLTRMEVLLCMGEIQGVLKGAGQRHRNPAGTGGGQYDGHWLVLGLVSPGTGRETSMRISAIEAERRWRSLWRMAFLSVVVPNRINDGDRCPR